MPKEYTPFLKDYWGWIYRSLMFLLRVIISLISFAILIFLVVFLVFCVSFLVKGSVDISLNGHKGINFENRIVFETSDDLLV